MKKSILLIMVFSLSLLAFVCYADSEKPEFEIHNGTRFNMTINEVIDLERKAGVNLTLADYSKGSNYDALYSAKCTLAGIEQSTIYYCFSKGKLVQCTYSLKDGGKGFRKIEDGLVNKYGNVTGDYGDVDFGYHRDAFMSNLAKNTQQHRLIPVANNYSIAIDHHMYYSIFDYHEVVYTLVEVDNSNLNDSDLNDL